MSSQIMETAETYTGEDICKQKTQALLTKFNLPKGLIPMTDVTEVGHKTATGFVWVRRKKKTQHLFSEIGRKVSYDVEVTAFVEEGRMRNLTGVKSKELLIWVGISDIIVAHNGNGKITFGTSSGLSRTFPVSAFEQVD
ncbi:hypothetical protein CTI12_AA548160 [Artemisia annua]|uniref:Uncharacterized protein n=1 Tax=Artemisia annua TaxID=35608 RepID=A0A2U1KZ69_ARTAN|nr:hypothetical protein CTI12_AA548160 [Artemisia annua]